MIVASGPAVYLDHVAGSGIELFDAACAADLEGIVAKRADGQYTPEETSWAKIKNRAYSQAEGRAITLTDGSIALRQVYRTRARAHCVTEQAAKPHSRDRSVLRRERHLRPRNDPSRLRSCYLRRPAVI